MSFATIRSGEPIPIFDGTDYPYWKDKMMRNIISIDLNAWNIVENGVMVLDKENLTEAEKKDLIIDNQVSLFITNHLVPNKYHEVKNIPSAKGVWEYLEKIVEGKSTQKEARIDILRSKFHRFKRHEGEKVNSIYNRLVVLANELESLGAKDVDPHMVVRMLLRSLDKSFSHVILMIKERSDYRKMVHADVLVRLTTFEKEEDEKREINGTRRITHALKAKASKYSSSEGSSASGTESDDPSGIGKDLALIVKRFNRFQRKVPLLHPRKVTPPSALATSTRQETPQQKKTVATNARNQVISLMIVLYGKLRESQRIHTVIPQENPTNRAKVMSQRSMSQDLEGKRNLSLVTRRKGSITSRVTVLPIAPLVSSKEFSTSKSL